eukprot:CAMPEP_0172304984 /NCGR_PEP_ID=MMETSP1058-20130122/6313_1 /TAXON_ID=83371 /ORGANISM="Detonula confervacea, Strain CCMP 353" /LENGTH=121 /DNA_ID=CAMNT_0013016403 /DNA_START=188 /DNA_END=550 /DNA_ORIENTATION=-
MDSKSETPVKRQVELTIAIYQYQEWDYNILHPPPYPQSSGKSITCCSKATSEAARASPASTSTSSASCVAIAAFSRSDPKSMDRFCALFASFNFSSDIEPWSASMASAAEDSASCPRDSAW